MENFKFCTVLSIPNNDLLETPISSNDTLELWGQRNKFWKPGQTLKVSFLEGEKHIQDKVIQFAKEWENYANIHFDFGNYKEDAQIRISFRKGAGSYSYIGTDCLSTPKSNPTMNFGWFDLNTSDEEYSRTVLHEFGHALGFGHEHQSPAGNIPWDKEKVYEYYWRTQKWDRKKVDENLFEKYKDSNTNYSQFDPHSIMLYSVPEELTIGDFKTEWNTRLSETDKKYALMFYPDGFKERLAALFGYVKNARLMATESRTEPQEGHLNWAIIHEIPLVQTEVGNDVQRTLDTLDGLNKEQINEIFGYMKNGQLIITTGKTEPHEGHVNWAKNKELDVVKQEIKNDANVIKDNERYRII
ncbi:MULTISPECIES: M12 family metallopeptidase [unclassified Cytobacillus]|uniref:M12 family metallopeptidase n=1 Tax=unclassified Cytobacillus TaxID=2675268 RepID=UPI00203DB199|nr:M12 family metallopeptidase [Cytobacillus sp. AMY 15.2]MCM3092201.1 M12 family metallopeptidase [Cytobacillus sp. AMY 15.2]